MKWVSNLWETIPGTPGQRALSILLGVLLVLFIAVMGCKPVETCVTQLLGTGGKYQTLRALGFGMGGILLVLQFLIANRRTDAAEKTAEEQVKATKEQAKANENTERGQRQERLKNAIEHLGHKSDSVRLGGAYELFHLAQDTPELRQTVLDILCAHIRRTTGEPKYRKDYERKPSEEIQSLLTLLFVQKHKVFTGLDINLQESWLNGSDLGQARLEKAVLRRTKLHGADLRYARLHGASLWNTQLHGAYLAGAQLHGADLMGAQLHGANLWRAQLCGASLGDTRLHEADLMGAQLRGAFSTLSTDGGESFEESINGRIDKEGGLSGAIFAGNLTQEDVASIGTGLSEGMADLLREKLEAHRGKPASNELPENSGVVLGKYTKEEADQWIAEYKTATSAVSES